MVNIEQAIEGLLKSARRAPLAQLKTYFDVRHNGTGFEIKECDIENLGKIIEGKVRPITNWEAGERITQGVRGACGNNARMWGYTMREAYIAIFEELLRSDIKDIQERNAEILSAC